MRKYRRLILIGGIAALVVIFFTTGLHEYLSLGNLKVRQSYLQHLYLQRPVLLAAAFSVVYIPVVAFNLPGAVVLGLAAGAIFGTLNGTLIVSFASTIGATLACLLSRYLFRNAVQRRFGERLKRVEAGIRREGAFYLFALRLTPVIPFFVINMAMGLTAMRLRTFYLVSQLGMLPGTAIFVHAGSQLGRIDSLSGMFSPGTILSLSLLGIFPLAARRAIAIYRRRYLPEKEPNRPSQQDQAAGKRSGIPFLEAIREGCAGCGTCQQACPFLVQYGPPKSIATEFNFSLAGQQALAYECSLCGLCEAVCPEGLNPAGLFLEVRRRCVAEGNFDPSPHRTILRYEKLGISPLFSWYGLPEGCDTVFFPGCALPGSRPAVTLEMFRYLGKAVPSLGVVLDCCTRPSHDLGRADWFKARFEEIKYGLIGRGVRTILTACPSCAGIFRQYGREFAVHTVYRYLRTSDFPPFPGERPMVSVHDPCTLRDDPATHEAVRELVSGLGYPMAEMEHRQRRTLCCGEGGSVAAANHEFARSWAARSAGQAVGQTMVTCCAGCAGTLNRLHPTVHVADLLFGSGTEEKLTPKFARAPFTYWNRLRLKQRLKKEMQVGKVLD